MTHEPDMTADEIEEDDGFIPPAVHVDDVNPFCPVCGRQLVKHKMMELLACQERQQDEDDDVDLAPEVVQPGPPEPPVPLSRIQPVLASREERLERSAALQREEWKREEEFVTEEVSVGLPPRSLPRLADGGIDYEALASGMRTVLEREKDEIVKRGGPIEKQNIDLKERLYRALEDAAMWRGRAQTNAEARNLAQKQVDEQTKTIRQLRNELKGRKESGQLTRVLEIKDLIRVAEATPGWKVDRTGGGHFSFKKDGVFVTDAASSGQGTKVNMATRVKLKKAGLDV